MHWRRKWQPTPVFLPGESQGREAWWAAVYGVAQSRARLKRRSSSSSSSSAWDSGFHCRGPGSVPGRGTEILQARKGKNKKNLCPERVWGRSLGAFSTGGVKQDWLQTKFAEQADRPLGCVTQTLGSGPQRPQPHKVECSAQPRVPGPVI